MENNLNEVWKEIYFTDGKEIFDYRGNYAVSNLGRIMNTKTKKIKTLCHDKYGYLTVSLWKNNKEKNLKVHRLVAFMFVDGWFENAVVNHKDEVKDNNVYFNLEWCTVAYNNEYNDRQKRCQKKVSLFSLEGKYIRDFESVKEASEYFGKRAGNLVSHLKGKQKTFSGHILKYKEEESCN